MRRTLAATRPSSAAGTLLPSFLATSTPPHGSTQEAAAERALSGVGQFTPPPRQTPGVAHLLTLEPLSLLHVNGREATEELACGDALARPFLFRARGTHTRKLTTTSEQAYLCSTHTA